MHQGFRIQLAKGFSGRNWLSCSQPALSIEYATTVSERMESTSTAQAEALRWARTDEGFGRLEIESECIDRLYSLNTP